MVSFDTLSSSSPYESRRGFGDAAAGVLVIVKVKKFLIKEEKKKKKHLSVLIIFDQISLFHSFSY